MREINNVRAPIAQHTIAIEVEGAPIEWMIQLVERFHLRRPAPEIPVQRLGLFLGLGECGDAAVFIHEKQARRFPRIDLVDAVQRAGFEQLRKLHRSARGVALITHLCDHAEFLFRLHQQIRLAIGMRQGFLHVHVFAHGHRQHGRWEVCVIGCHHCYGIDVLAHLFEHHTEICKLLHARVAFEVGVHAARAEINIGKRHRRGGAIGGPAGNHSGGTATDAHAPEIHPLTRWLFALARAAGGQVGGQEGETESGCRRFLQKVATLCVLHGPSMTSLGQD